MLLLIFIIGAAVTACWYLGVVFFLLRGLHGLTPAEQAHGHQFSIVIAARNEENNIAHCLDTVFSQTIDPNRFEVIVVNDRSTDATQEIINRYKKRFPQLTSITIDTTPAGISPKKHAVTQGVARAKYDIIVFTDADCRVPPTWLDTIDRFFTPPVGLVQGITAYHYLPGMNRLFFNLQSIDFLSHGIVAAAAIGADIPINSNANNFAFRREAFDASGGLTTNIGHVVSGDDDLLLQKIWKQHKWKILFMTDHKGTVTTMPTPTLYALFQQRARWGSKTVHYNSLQVLLLTGVFLFYLFVATSFVVSVISAKLYFFTILLFLIKFIGEAFLMIPGLRHFGHSYLLPLLPVASLLQLPLVLFAVLIGIFGKFSWKEQSFSRTINP